MGVSSFRRFRALQRNVRALGEAQTAAFSSWAWAADPIFSQGVVRGCSCFNRRIAGASERARATSSPCPCLPS
eukprot:10901976-Alexandrium_andersonii.AAC.1